MTANPKQGMEYLGVNHVALVAVDMAETVAVACPFCRTMISDGLTVENAEDVQVQDVAQLLLRAVKPQEQQLNAPS